LPASASTGETAAFGRTRDEAYLKALLATGFKLPIKNRNILLSIGSFSDKQEFLESARRLISMNYHLFGTSGTADFMQENGIEITELDWEEKKP